MLKLHFCNLWLKNASSGRCNDTAASLNVLHKAFSGSLVEFDLPEDKWNAPKAEGNRDARPFIHIRTLADAVLNKFAVYTSAPHLTFMSPFYAFITLDTPDPAKRVVASLICQFQEHGVARKSKTPPIPRFVSATLPLPFSDTNIKTHYMADRKQTLTQVCFCRFMGGGVCVV